MVRAGRDLEDHLVQLDHERNLRFLGFFPVISMLRFSCLPVEGQIESLKFKVFVFILNKIKENSLTVSGR